MLKAIIFDFDGVLADSYKANLETCRLFHVDLSEQDFKDHHNGNVYEKPKVKFQEGDLEKYFSLMKERLNENHLFPILHQLPKLKKDFRLFIISSTLEDNIEHFLNLAGQADLFERILGLNAHRTKVEKFKMIFHDFSLSPAECLFVTDTIGDIIEARKIKIDTIAVSWGYHDQETLEREKPLAIVHDENELLAKINSLNLL